MVAWILAAVAAIAAIGALLVATSRSRALGAANEELTRLREELEKAQQRVSRRSDAERRRDEELAELRRRLEKTKKRASQARDGERQESERIRELAEKLRLAEADTRAMRGEVQRLEAALEAQRGEARPPPKPAPPAPAPAPAEPPPPTDDALQKRAAEARALALEEQLVAARVDVERMKRKAAAQERLYVAIRGELDAKKERLRTQQEELERLRALRLVLADDLAEPEAPPASDGPPAPASEPDTVG